MKVWLIYLLSVEGCLEINFKYNFYTCFYIVNNKILLNIFFFIYIFSFGCLFK